MSISEIINNLKLRIRGEIPLSAFVKAGMHVGTNFWYGNQCTFDISHCWLIHIGNNVTFSSRVHLLVHDASLKLHTGYAKIEPISIGDNVFVGADSTILPGVHVGAGSIIGAKSLVTKDIPPNEVWGGIQQILSVVSMNSWKNIKT